MKIHRFIGPFDLTKKEIEITGDIAHQILKVLRLKISEKIEIVDSKGISAMATIKNINSKSLTVAIEKIIKHKENKNNMTLFCAILKKENFELVVQKTTECGIYKIVPIISSRTIKNGLNIERLKKIAKEASEQSGRNTIPEISEPITFEKSLETINEKDFNILFDITGKRLEFDSGVTKSKNINIFIGPEGGWTEDEIKKTKERNFQIINLGPLTLRGETAAIISTYLISNL